MLNKKRKVSTGGTLETMIGPGTTIQGDISFEGGLRLDGTVEGTVSAPDGSGSRLVISDQAEIRGYVQVPNVIVNGRIFGDIRASERLELHPQANVQGDLYYEVIQMEEGAGLTGTCSHISATNKGQAASPPLEGNSPEVPKTGGEGVSGGGESGAGPQGTTKEEAG